jgi:carbon-monoxide dehydrogenase large subunit
MIPAAPIIGNAIKDALGVRITSMPITAEKVALSVMKEQAKQQGR